MMDEAQSKVIDAYRLASRGNFDHARLILEETLYDHPNHIEGWLLLADLAQDAEEARQCYQMILEFAPNNWIAQQRMKILFGQQEAPTPDPEGYEPLKIFEDEVEEELQPEEPASLLEPKTANFLDELAEEDAVKEPPTVRESLAAHEELLKRVGIGLIVLFGCGILSWVVSVGYIVWKTGFLAWFGF